MAKHKLSNKSFTDELKRILMANDESRLKEFTESLVQQAMDGDTKAAAIIIDRIEGKVTEKIEVSSDDGIKQLVASADELAAKLRGPEVSIKNVKVKQIVKPQNKATVEE